MTAKVPAPEFSRMIDLRQISDAPLVLTASPEECRALAARFDLVSVDRLEATVTLVPERAVVTVTGRLNAAWVQPCAISGEDLALAASEPLSFRFIPAATTHTPVEEVELSDEACDEIEYDGTAFDVGEAVAQSLGLAIDPFACGPDAEAARKAAGILDESASGPFAALAGLKVTKD